MKTKSIKFSIFALLISLVCGLSFALIPNRTISASAAGDAAVISQYMLQDGQLVDGKPVKTTEEAGTTTGYGKVVLGEKNVQLTAQANDGFVLVGWYIVYEDSTVEYIEIDTDAVVADKDNTITAETYTVLNKKANLTISEVSQHLQVEPVFDYERYLVQYRDVNTGALENKGTYKFGDTVLIEVDVDSNVNVDVLNARIKNVELTEGTSGENYYNITKVSTTGRTTAYEVCFTVAAYEDVVVEIGYDVLYRIDLNLQLEAEELTDTTAEEYKQIFSAVTVNNAYKVLNDERTSFFVKQGKNFNVSALKNYSFVPTGEGTAYSYYNLKTLDGKENVYVKNYNDINEDKELIINYEHTRYNINFIGAMYDESNQTISVDNNLNVKPAIASTRVASPATFTDADLVENIGYTFEGYAIRTNASTYTLVTTLEDVEIDDVRPSAIDIYVCYSATVYSIKINKSSLINKTLINTAGDNVYPLSALKVNGTTKTIEQLMAADADALLFGGFVIGNTVKLEEVVSNGFTVNGFYTFGNEDDIKNEFVLDVDFLNGKSTEIELFIDAELNTYTFEYVASVKQGVFMSDISIDNKTTLEAMPGVTVTEVVTAGVEKKITVTGVNLYTVIDLRSVPLLIEGSAEYYVFNWYTADGKTRLTNTVDDGVTPNAYLHSYIVSQDGTRISVVYSQPSTFLRINFEGLPSSKIKFPTDAAGEDDSAKISYEVSQNGTPVVADEGIYELDIAKAFTLSLSNVTGNDNLFGYEFVGYRLIREDETDADDIRNGSSETYTYEIPSGLAGSLFVLDVRFAKIEYNFVIEAKSGEVLFDANLTIENPVIRFTKAEGYYISAIDVEFKDGAGFDNSGKIPQQSNATKNVIENVGGEAINLFREYYHMFTEAEFKEIVELYAYKKDADNILDVYAIADYALYRYVIDIDLVKYYQNTLVESDGIGFPNIELYYRAAGSSEDVKVNTELVSGYRFNNIPYGANVTLKVLSGANTGYTLKGWYVYENSAIPVDSNSANRVREIKNIAADYQYAFRIDYIGYNVVLDYADGQGNPTINDSTSVVLKNDDTIDISANPIIANGYLFDSLRYTKPVYTEYTYNSATWLDDCANLYILDGSYIANTSSVYDNEKTYYTLSYEEVVLTSVGDLTKFNSENFKVEDFGDNIVKIGVVYRSAAMTIEHIANTAFNLGKVNLTTEDIASYIVTKNGEATPIGKDGEVTVNDIVKVVIKINRNAENSETGETYDLSRGLTLNEKVSVSNKEVKRQLAKDDNGDDVYVIEFAVSNFVNEISAKNGVLTINYQFSQIKTTLITVTTNMASSSSFISSTNLIVNNGQEVQSNGNPSSYQINDFLNSLYVRFEPEALGSKIKSQRFSVYHSSVSAVNLIKPEDYGKYYISPVKQEVITNDGTSYDAIYQVNLRATDKNIIVVFEVEPILFFEGKEAVDGYTFTPTYKIDEDGNGVAQTITLGQNAVLKNNINGFDISESVIEVEYYKNGAKLTGGAIDVGSYEIKLKVKANAPADHWLRVIGELPYKINMEIQALKIKLKAVTTQFDRQYDSTYDYDIGLTMTANGWESKDRFIKFVGSTYEGMEFSLSQLELAETYAAEITITQKDGTQRTESNVTAGRYVNIKVTGLALKNNNNLILDSSEMLLLEVVRIIPKSVEIQHLEAYNKVRDGNEYGTFGIEEGYDALELYYRHTGDDVYLIPENIKIYFAKMAEAGETYDVEVDGVKYVYVAKAGANRHVIVDATNALDGEHSENYVVGKDGRYVYKDRKHIYQDELTTTVKGYGSISVVNVRGLSDPSKANLIPFDSTLVVEVIEANSVEYVEMYKHISKYLSRSNVFAIGYKLSIVDGNGITVPVSNELYLSLPKPTELTGAISLSGELSDKVQYVKNEGNITIDLQQINEEVSYIILTQNRVLLELWQIILIVAGVAAVAAGAVITVVVVRRKKALGYSGFDKI